MNHTVKKQRRTKKFGLGFACFVFSSLEKEKRKRKEWWWILPPRQEKENMQEEGPSIYKLCINSQQHKMPRHSREVKRALFVTLMTWSDSLFFWMSPKLRLCTESAEQNFLCYARCLISITRYRDRRSKLWLIFLCPMERSNNNNNNKNQSCDTLMLRCLLNFESPSPDFFY